MRQRLRNWLLGDVDKEFHAIRSEILIESSKQLAQQAKLLEALTAINKSLAQFALQKAKEPEELTNAQRAALIGLPENYGDQVDWARMR